MANHFSLVGLAPARTQWLTTVTGWITSGIVPAELTKCFSAADVRPRLGAMRPCSALLIDADLAELDRDLIKVAARNDVPVFIIDDNSARAFNWLEMGAATVLSNAISPADFLSALNSHARSASSKPGTIDSINGSGGSATGDLIAVCGPGGTGTSTVAIALAQGLSFVRRPETILLADFARNGEQAMLHDTPDVIPSVEELIESSRTHTLNGDDVQRLTFDIVARNYRLLLGMRRKNAWSRMQPAAIDAGILALRRSFSVCICDITADFEGEQESGSADVEERNYLARSTATNASALAIVGHAGLKGTHALARTIREALVLGVDSDRILPIVNAAPKDKRTRREISSALTHLVQTAGASTRLNEPVFLPTKETDRLLSDGQPLPKALTEPLAEAMQTLLNNAGPIDLLDPPSEPEAVSPGSLGVALREAI
jgi:hypothetical protein